MDRTKLKPEVLQKAKDLINQMGLVRWLIWLHPGLRQEYGGEVE